MTDKNIKLHFHAIGAGFEKVYRASQLAVISVDMWNTHWSRPAVKRAEALAPHVNEFLEVARQLGIQIVHAPSECGDWYTNHKQLEQLHALHAVKYEKDAWQQVVTREQRDFVWDKAPWLYEDFDLTGNKNKLYEQNSDEEGKPLPPDWTKLSDIKEKLRQTEKIDIADQDLMVIDNFICTEPGCPKLNDGNDGHFHLAQFLANEGIECLLYVGIHTNYCVVFSRPYSLWPMSTFTKKGDPKDGSHHIFQAALVSDLTDPFLHPIKTGALTHETGKKAFLDWLMSNEDKINGGQKNNFNHEKGVRASTIFSKDLFDVR